MRTCTEDPGKADIVAGSAMGGPLNSNAGTTQPASSVPATSVLPKEESAQQNGLSDAPRSEKTSLSAGLKVIVRKL